MTIFRFALLRSMRQKVTLGLLCIAPLAMIFIEQLWSPEYGTGFLFYGLVVMFAAFSLVRLTMTDRVSGTIVRIFAAPVTTIQYLAQNLLAFWLILNVPTLLMIGIGSIRYGWEGNRTALLLLCYLVFNAAAITLSLAWNAMFHSKVMADTIFSVVVSFMALLGGVFIPLPMLPDFLQKIGMATPLYWFSNAITRIQGQEAAEGYWSSILIMLLFSAAFLLFGGKRRLE